MAPKELQVFQAEEVRKHASEGDLWIIIDGSVYDMSVFIDMHPGGVFPILEYAGKDATEAFYGMHRQEVLFKYDRYKIGTVAGVEPQITLNVPGTISMVPYAELSAWQGYKSPYYKVGANIKSEKPISAPTILNFGSPALKEKVIPQVFSGEKRMSLAITEPYTGSDVSSIKTTAVRSADGKHFIVNGVKKWITTGCWAHFFSTAVRTEKGISMLLIERSEGVETKLIKTSYSTCAGTAYVSFENVKVPVENLLGEEGNGFFYVLSNFNHERWSMLANATMGARLVIEECFKWANQRKVFGKRLVDQPVIRNKLARMISSMESAHSWLENLTYQMNHMNYNEQAAKLAGPMALCKYQVSRMLHNVSDDACQIYGGRALTKTGMGRQIETLQRTYKFTSILGGSEEIMADLGVRQALKNMPSSARL